jgi:uncharacterized protein (DUF1697 family)
MALVAFLRGVNVGGHRRFRPSLLAKELAHYDVVNIGATGLLIARAACEPTAFRAELLAALPFEAEVALCEGDDVLDAMASAPFAETEAGVVPFVSIAVGPAKPTRPRFPIQIPPTGEWYVRILGRRKRFFFGIYRRHVKTIGFLGRLDAALGVRVTTRNWNTMLLVQRELTR